MTTAAEANLHWDLGKLYAGPADPRIQADLRQAHMDAAAFRDRYYGKVASLGSRELVEALEAQARLSVLLNDLYAYPSLAFAIDTNDEAVRDLLGKLRVELTEIQTQTQFFELELQQTPPDVFQTFLVAPVLAPYRYHLERVRKFTPHTLTEAEEAIMAIKDVTGKQAWNQLFTEITSRMMVKLNLPDGEKTVTVSEARALRSSPDRRVRKASAAGVLLTHAEQSHVLTYIFNTLYEDHRHEVRLRNYPDPMAPTLLGEDLEPEVIEALLSAVEQHYVLAQRFYKIKAKVLGLADFSSYDTLAPLGEAEKAVSYAEAKQIVLDAFRSFSPRFAEDAESFFSERYIDVPPAPGKQGGAFCAGMRPGLHPFVMLNYQDKLRDVMTIAHELGHGVHFMLAGEAQNLYNYQPITPLAETASTFGEMLTVNRLLSLETDPAVRRQLLANRIEDALGTIMRQVMLTRWEQRAHALRQEGEVGPEEFSRLWLEETRKLYGDVVRIEDWDQWGWITIPHVVHYRFYCYSYAFGMLLVYALIQQYQEEGQAFVPKFIEVLRAGGSAPVGQILAGVGIDIKDPKFWQKGLTLLSATIDEFEAAVAAS